MNAKILLSIVESPGNQVDNLTGLGFYPGEPDRILSRHATDVLKRLPGLSTRILLPFFPCFLFVEEEMWFFLYIEFALRSFRAL